MSIVEHPYFYQVNDTSDGFELRREHDNRLIATFGNRDYADYVTTMLNLTHNLGKQAFGLLDL